MTPVLCFNFRDQRHLKHHMNTFLGNNTHKSNQQINSQNHWVDHKEQQKTYLKKEKKGGRTLHDNTVAKQQSKTKKETKNEHQTAQSVRVREERDAKASLWEHSLCLTQVQTHSVSRKAGV